VKKHADTIERVRRLTRRCARLDKKLEALVERSADVRRAFTYQRLEREAAERLKAETAFLGYLVAAPSSGKGGGT
jgi:predicted transcriptional regulator